MHQIKKLATLGLLLWAGTEAVPMLSPYYESKFHILYPHFPSSDSGLLASAVIPVAWFIGYELFAF